MSTLKVVTWNINSINARGERLVAFLRREDPDILCLQELKVDDEHFPHDIIVEAGFQAAIHGQRTYNGVAILSKVDVDNVTRGMGPNDSDSQARVIAATLNGIRFISAYFPNGKAVGTDKYEYKLAWMKRLHAYLASEINAHEHLVLCGDYNVAIDDLDVARPDEWRHSVLCHDAAREALNAIAALGFTDVVRQHHPEGGVYSWWDYRMLGFPKGNGLRIDHIFTTADLAAGSVSARVDRDERKGKKPSDHAPVIAEFTL